MPTPKISVQDVDAYSDVSNGSTISLASGGSEGNEYSSRPPTGAGPKRARSAQAKRSRVGTKSGSPYASRQQQGRPQSAKPSNRSLWLSAMKNGMGSLSTENTGMTTWAGPRPAHATKKRGPGARTRNFSDVVELTSGKPKTHTRSATLSYTEPLVTGGGPAYKPPEDYYDEVIELKKIVNSLKQENNILNTKLHRTEQENVLKDRQIEDFLNSRKHPEDMRRTLTDKKGDTSSIVNSLKQKLHAVERTVKDKEAELGKLKRDMKLTDVDELSLQTEMYYQEVQRLQLALIEQQQSSVLQQPQSSRSADTSLGRGKRPISASAQMQQDETEFLKAENKSLKKDMIALIEGQAKKDKKKPLKAEYADMSRGQLLQAIRELETRVEDTEAKKKSKTSEKSRDSLSSEDEKVDSKRKQSKEMEGRLELRGSTTQKLSQLREREAELLEEQSKQRQVIERLKEDRTHYRNVADELRQKLQTAEDELERLRGTTEQTPNDKPRGSITSTASQYSPRKPSLRAKDRDEQMERELDEFQQRHAAKTLQKQWRQYRGQKKVETERERYEQDQAAQTLQKQWRKHRDHQRFKDDMAQDEAVTDIQSVLRGHLVRQGRLVKLGHGPEEPDSDDAIVNIQSAMRGHMTRAGREQRREDRWSRDSPRDTSKRSDQALSDSEDSDDGIVMGSTKGTSGYVRTSPRDSTDKSPFSSHKRSRFTATSPPSDSYPPQPLPRTKISPPSQPSSSLSHPSPTPSCPPRPAPRTLYTPDSTPPLPRPRQIKPSVPTITLPESDSDDGVVVGGSKAARHSANAGINTHARNHQLTTHNSHAQPETSAHRPKGYRTEQQPSNAASSADDSSAVVKGGQPSDTESDSDNDLVVSGSRKKADTSSSTNKEQQAGIRTNTQQRETQRQEAIQRIRTIDENLERDFREVVDTRNSRGMEKLAVATRSECKEKVQRLHLQKENVGMKSVNSRAETTDGITKLSGHDALEDKEDGRKENPRVGKNIEKRDVYLDVEYNGNEKHGDVSRASSDVVFATYGIASVKDGTASAKDRITSATERETSANKVLEKDKPDTKCKVKRGYFTTTNLEGDVMLVKSVKDENTLMASGDHRLHGTSDENVSQPEYIVSLSNKYFAGFEMPGYNIPPKPEENVTEPTGKDATCSLPSNDVSSNILESTTNINSREENNYGASDSSSSSKEEPLRYEVMKKKETHLQPDSSRSVVGSGQSSSGDGKCDDNEQRPNRGRPPVQHKVQHLGLEDVYRRMPEEKDIVESERTKVMPEERVHLPEGKGITGHEAKEIVKGEQASKQNVSEETNIELDGIRETKTKSHLQVFSDRDSCSVKKEDENVQEVASVASDSDAKLRKHTESGLTKRINPQRTIEEASEDSDQNMVIRSSSGRKEILQGRKTSASERKTSTSDRKTSVSKRKTSFSERMSSVSERRTSAPAKEDTRKKGKSSKIRHEIIDSEDDDDDDDVVVTSSKYRSAKDSGPSQQLPGPSRQSGSASHRSSVKQEAISSGTSGSYRLGMARGSSKERESVKAFGKSSRQIDDDSDEDSDDAIVTSKRATPVGKTGKSSTRSSFRKADEPFGKSSRQIINNSDDDSDDAIVTSKRATPAGKTGKSTSPSSFSKAAPSKGQSFVDGLFSSAPKSRTSTAAEKAARRRSLFDDDDDDSDDDDDDIVVSFKGKSKAKSKPPASKRDSLSSLWSGSTRQKNQQSGAGLGFRTFDAGLPSSSRKTDSRLDELF